MPLSCVVHKRGHIRIPENWLEELYFMAHYCQHHQRHIYTNLLYVHQPRYPNLRAQVPPGAGLGLPALDHQPHCGLICKSCARDISSDCSFAKHKHVVQIPPQNRNDGCDPKAKTEQERR